MNQLGLLSKMFRHYIGVTLAVYVGIFFTIVLGRKSQIIWEKAHSHQI